MSNYNGLFTGICIALLIIFLVTFWIVNRDYEIKVNRYIKDSEIDE